MYFYTMITNKILKRFTYSWVLAAIVALLATSCSGNMSDDGMDVVTYIKLSSSEGSTIKGKTVNFTVTDNLNNDVTAKSEFYIDGILNADGASFTPLESGKYEVVAKMDGLKTKPFTLEVVTLSGVNFVSRLLYEDYTGTWCGNCPLAVVRYENLLLKNENVVFMGVHGPKNSGDPYINETSLAIINLKDVWAFPKILINGKYSWATNDNNYTDMSFPLGYMQPSSKIGISVSTQLSGNSVSGEVNISFAQTYQNLKMAVFVVENDLHYPQHNYFNGQGGMPLFYDGVPIVENYTHHNVLRDKLTAVAGDAIPAAQSQENMIYTKAINYNVPANFVKANTKLIVIIMDGNNVVLNTREAVIGTENSLETI